MKKNLCKISWISSILILLIVCTMSFLSSPDYINYSDESVLITEDKDGLIKVHLSGEITNYEISLRSGENNIYDIQTWNSLLSRNVLRKSIKIISINPGGDKVAAIYYSSNNGQVIELIYGNNYSSEKGTLILPRLALNMYFALFSLILVVFIFMWLLSKNYYEIRKVLEKLMMLMFAYLVGHLIVKGLDGSSYSILRDLKWILAIAVAINAVYYSTVTFIKYAKFTKKKIKQ